MNIRDALIYQSPSLELQRAAADEIACLDRAVDKLSESLTHVLKSNWGQTNQIADLMWFLESWDMLEDFREWQKLGNEQ